MQHSSLYQRGNLPYRRVTSANRLPSTRDTVSWWRQEEPAYEMTSWGWTKQVTTSQIDWTYIWHLTVCEPLAGFVLRWIFARTLCMYGINVSSGVWEKWFSNGDILSGVCMFCRHATWEYTHRVWCWCPTTSWDDQVLSTEGSDCQNCISVAVCLVCSQMSGKFFYTFQVVSRWLWEEWRGVCKVFHWKVWKAFDSCHSYLAQKCDAVGVVKGKQKCHTQLVKLENVPQGFMNVSN